MPGGPGLAAGRLRRHVGLLDIAGLRPRLPLRQGLRALIGERCLLSWRLWRRTLHATLMGTGVVLLRLPRRDLWILWRLGLRRKLFVTLLRILRLAEIVAVCHLAPWCGPSRGSGCRASE